MGVERLLKATVVAPASRTNDLLTALLKFGEFHPSREDLKMAEALEPLYDRARRLYLELEAAVRELEVEAGGGVIEVLIKGEPEPEEISVGDVEDLLEELSRRAEPILRELRELNERISTLASEIERLERERARLSVYVELGLDLSKLLRFRHVFVSAYIVPVRDLEEVVASLENASVTYRLISRESVLLVVVAAPMQRERVERVLRTFSLTPVEVKADEPLEMIEARFRAVVEELERLRASAADLAARKNRIKLERGREVASLRGLAKTLVETLQRMTGVSGRLLVVEGYVPESFSDAFVKEVGRLAYVHLSETSLHHGLKENPPTRLRNNWITESFRPVTLIQGPPAYYEVDPTPLVSVFLSVFYGIMFADLGQGLVLTLLGLVLSFRAKSALKLWGRLIMFLGISSSIGGFMIQEAFGFKLTPVTGVKPVLELLEHHGGSATISTEAVIKLFTFAPLLGFVHVSLGLIISAYILARHGEWGEAIFSKAASLLMYIFGLLFALSFITTRGFGGLLTSGEPVPLLGLPAGLVGTIGVYGVVFCMALLIVGRVAGSLAGLLPRGSILGQIGTGLLEILENIIHFMSNTLSYLRISILMIIHVALMLLINSAWEALGPASLGILVIGNIGVMGLEGLLVFIQALRLHLYEFFTKFFTGGGTLFKPLSFGSEGLRIVFKD
ncbi:MAG: V-type ATPase 116kDa subunit family protein [Nitrososphaerota archaeon]|nr:hypothetical protein [Candidatus Calditenuaceae archaeon]MDW8072867.1 V-type ATPase 116kDa subunit family protein [Nitrososphaerota archaeon]